MRRILLDSCVWLWWLDDNSALGKQAKALINDGRNQLFISAATVWEIAIKRQKGNLQIEGDLQALVLEDGFIPLNPMCDTFYLTRPSKSRGCRPRLKLIKTAQV